ncbi:hypothetical protein [Halotia branconii]|uniref:Uncharacterized protein n=1 Tax=Halotia branconii CENA392 TaxID=1539056 RepID=A0AAJ6NWM2_9CYAN|nr:hypothetical protein [Halotia branconii]WGV28105.1 hypothetical protein QI031_11790 [Halotia branconii CENA392]
MSKCPRPFYTNKHSTQTLQQGLDEYYAVNPNLTNPQKLPPEFAKILLAHDVSHIIYGCDTGMYDELKLLPLIWWTSDYKFRDHLSTLQDSTISPAIRVMYDDLIKQHGVFWLYGSIFLVLPRLLPELIVILWRNRQRQCYFPFLNFESLLERSLLEIRQDFDLLPLMK